MIICKNSRFKGDVPEGWKMAERGPVFTERKKEEPGNSELICLTLINGKIIKGLFK